MQRFLVMSSAALQNISLFEFLIITFYFLASIARHFNGHVSRIQRNRRNRSDRNIIGLPRKGLSSHVHHRQREPQRLRDLDFSSTVPSLYFLQFHQQP